MALTGDHHHVAAAGPGDSVGDRRPAVPDLDDVRTAGFASGAGHDGGPDRSRILVSRVVVGDHDQVGELGRDRAHRFALAGITVATGAEHHGQSRPGPTQGLQHRAQRTGLVGVVDDG